jgi:hypothetical protein
MYEAKNYETVNMLLQNPTLWNKGMIKETLQRFKKSHSYEDRDFNMRNVQELIKDYLLTLSDAMKKEEARKKEDNVIYFNPFVVSGI